MSDILQQLFTFSGLVLVAGAMYRMGSFTRQQQMDISATKKSIEDIRGDVNVMVQSYDVVNKRIDAQNKQIALLAQQYEVIHIFVERLGQVERKVDSQLAVCAVRHENTLRMELNNRQVNDPLTLEDPRKKGEK